MDLMKRVRETIETYGMIETGDGVIAGVSGGADSVCLLAALREYRREKEFSLTAVHVEHGLRGQDSLEDAAFVEALCREWQIPCRVERVSVRERAAAAGQTLEEAGRQARYEAFERWALRENAARIAVAHNENDQAETVLLNMARGSGLRGMGGIRPVRGRIIRPLLFVSRKEIEEWLMERGIGWRTDATNLETDYTRNKLRLQALPWLEREINAGAVRHLAAEALHMQRAQEYLERQAEKIYASCVRWEEETGQVCLSLTEFLGEDELMQEYVLRMAVSRALGSRGLKDYGEVHIRQMLRLCRMDCGRRMDFPGRMQALRRDGELVLAAGHGKGQVPAAGRRGASALGEQPVVPGDSLGPAAGGSLEERESPIESAPWVCELGGDGEYTFLGYRFQVKYLDPCQAPACFPEKKYTKWLAYDTITNNVCLRTRRTGDYLVIDGKGGRKKLKDYLIDQKVPREERDRVILLAQGSHILWVAGYRISEGAKVTADTKGLIQIQMMVEDGI